MKNVKSKGREKIELLKKLLDKEYSKRDDLGKNLHGKKNTLYVLSHNLSRFENLPNTKTIARKHILEQKDLTAQLLSDLQEIRKDIFPSILSFGGILVALKEYCTQMENKTGLGVVIDCAQIDEILLGSNKDPGIYYICVEIIEYLRISGFNKVLLKFKSRKDIFDIYIEGTGKIKISANETLENKLDTIKGLIIWKDIKVLATTNWQNIFKLRFRSPNLI